MKCKITTQYHVTSIKTQNEQVAIFQSCMVKPQAAGLLLKVPTGRQTQGSDLAMRACSPVQTSFETQLRSLDLY